MAIAHRRLITEMYGEQRAGLGWLEFPSSVLSYGSDAEATQ